MNKDRTVVLIGPPSAGKSTIAPLLAAKLGLERVELDEVRWAYYDEIGFDHAEAKRLSEAGDIPAMLASWKPFEVHSVERVLQDHSGKLIEFGGGQTVYKNPEFAARVQTVLAPVPHVILLMPTPDLAESCHILRQRTLAKSVQEGWQPDEAVLALFDTLARSPDNRKLAKYTAYTYGRTPEAVAQEVAGWVAG